MRCKNQYEINPILELFFYGVYKVKFNVTRLFLRVQLINNNHSLKTSKQALCLRSNS